VLNLLFIVNTTSGIITAAIIILKNMKPYALPTLLLPYPNRWGKTLAF